MVAFCLRIEVVGDGEIGIESKGAIEGMLRPLHVAVRVIAEFSQEMVNTAEARPCRGVIGALFETLQVEVAGNAHVIQGSSNGDLVGAKIVLIGPGAGRNVAMRGAAFPFVERHMEGLQDAIAQLVLRL